MDPVLSLGAAFLGFLLTFFVWNRAVHWGYSIWNARKATDSNPKASLALPALLFANSGPWFVVGYAGICYYIFATPHRPEWVWFWAGAAVVPPLILLLVVSVMRRRKNAEAAATASAVKGSQDAA